MELDFNTKQVLADLLAKPAMVSPSHAGMLSDLIVKYPYYQTLHLLLAKATVNEDYAPQTLSAAALYNNGNLLHRIIHYPETFSITDKNVSSISSSTKDEQETFDEIAEVADVVDENAQQLDEEILLNEEEEVFEEIAEVSLPPVQEDNAIAQQDEEEIFEEIAEVETSNFEPASIDEEKIVEEDLVFENIVAADFFAFEEHFTTEEIVEPVNELTTIFQPEEYNLEAEAQTVSKYNDDKLPYTFLWWLAKTRKEHEQIFQPYVTQKKTENTSSGELQHQYVEHIFHLQTPFNAADDISRGPLNKQIVPKGFDIIDSFIKNDPQIKAPKAEQINNENKAKKSAEDNYDLVSETLAAIYIEQMLYHKAIDTYEKLSLKFPEKSRYFADLIQSLEKKI